MYLCLRTQVLILQGTHCFPLRKIRPGTERQMTSSINFTTNTGAKISNRFLWFGLFVCVVDLRDLTSRSMQGKQFHIQTLRPAARWVVFQLPQVPREARQSSSLYGLSTGNQDVFCSDALRGELVWAPLDKGL